MEPYENNPNNENKWYPTPESTDESKPADAPAPEVNDGEYRMVRPDAGRSWKDAEYTPSDETTAPPRYYEPPEEKPKKEKQPREKGNTTLAKVACLCLCCALIGGIAGGAVVGSLSGEPAATQPPVLAASPSPTASGTQLATTSAGSIYEMACEQVIGISTETTTNYFGMPVSTPVSGSGFIITQDGYIMTNYHVIEGAVSGGFEVKVVLHNGEEYTAQIVGYDDDNDIAVLKIEASGLSAVSIGNSDSIAVGDTLYAIGNPLGELAYSMTSGIVSATDRVISTDASTSINMFQLDAAVNPGNSGGPVYNTAGQVVGVVTAKSSESGVEGLGFAIPINDAVELANSIISNGYVTGKAYMAISPRDINASALQYYNMPQGVYVYEVFAGGAAEAAGVKVGDIITELDGTATASVSELKTAIKTHSAGDSVSLKIYRSGEYLDLTIVFDEEVPAQAAAQTQEQQQQQGQYSNGYGW